MKKKVMEPNLIFAVAEEMIKDNGEDSYYYASKDGHFFIVSLDGCGGSGSKRYMNYSGKTGAYVASRAVCGGIESWFLENGNEKDFKNYIERALSVCKGYADKSGRITGSLGKSFPTTVSAVSAKFNQGKIDACCLWAGDSRCYMLDEKGLHQLTQDDLDGEDAMSNLTSDGIMTNVVNATAPFDIHQKNIRLDAPCVFFTATDGCFGYLKTPMAFENLLIGSLMEAQTPAEWRVALNERMSAVAGDDYTLCVAVCGYKDFADLKKAYVPRFKHILENYINSDQDPNFLWETYKEEYSKYI